MSQLPPLVEPLSPPMRPPSGGSGAVPGPRWPPTPKEPARLSARPGWIQEPAERSRPSTMGRSMPNCSLTSWGGPDSPPHSPMSPSLAQANPHVLQNAERKPLRPLHKPALAKHNLRCAWSPTRGLSGHRCIDWPEEGTSSELCGDESAWTEVLAPRGTKGPNGEHTYFWNISTDETCWERPSKLASPAQFAQKASSSSSSVPGPPSVDEFKLASKLASPFLPRQLETEEPPIRMGADVFTQDPTGAVDVVFQVVMDLCNSFFHITVREVVNCLVFTAVNLDDPGPKATYTYRIALDKLAAMVGHGHRTVYQQCQWAVGRLRLRRGMGLREPQLGLEPISGDMPRRVVLDGLGAGFSGSYAIRDAEPNGLQSCGVGTLVWSKELNPSRHLFFAHDGEDSGHWILVSGFEPPYQVEYAFAMPSQTPWGLPEGGRWEQRSGQMLPCTTDVFSAQSADSPKLDTECIPFHTPELQRDCQLAPPEQDCGFVPSPSGSPPWLKHSSWVDAMDSVDSGKNPVLPVETYPVDVQEEVQDCEWDGADEEAQDMGNSNQCSSDFFSMGAGPWLAGATWTSATSEAARDPNDEAFITGQCAGIMGFDLLSATGENLKLEFDLLGDSVLGPVPLLGAVAT